MRHRSPMTQAKISAALARAQAELRGVAHDAKNTHHRYSYTSAEALIAAVTDAIKGHGLAFVCSSQTSADPRLAVCEYTLIHESGETLGPWRTELAIVPGNGRPQDKATLAAYTECHAYALRGVFNIPRAEATIAGRDDTGYSPAAEAAAASEQAAARSAAWRAWKSWAEAHNADAREDLPEMWAAVLNRKQPVDAGQLRTDDLRKIASFYQSAIKAEAGGDDGRA